MPRIFADDADSVDVFAVIHFLIGGFSTNENSTTEYTEDHGKKKAVVAAHLNMLTNESGENVSKFEVTVREMSHELRTPLTSIMVCGVAARGRELDGADSGILDRDKRRVAEVKRDIQSLLVDLTRRE